jgi:hypothetical protein
MIFMGEGGALPPPQDSYIERLKASRKSPAVLKTKLAKIRSARPRLIVFAFEGDTDKTVYVQWVRLIRPDLEYEPFPCDGKAGVLDFRAMLGRDRGDLGSGVYFFIDRDFDDLRGNELGPKTFMTDHYSVENYLVSGEVLEELLKDEFHCHAEPIVRASVLNLFDRQLTEFLSITREVNFRIFLARRLGIKIVSGLPDKVRHLAQIELNVVLPATGVASDIIVLAREPAREEYDQLAAEFDGFDPASRYRGKFSYAFFIRWLDLLSQDRADAQSRTFAGIDTRRVNHSGLTLGMLASKSSPPRQLADFIHAVRF